MAVVPNNGIWIVGEREVLLGMEPKALNMLSKCSFHPLSYSPLLSDL